MGVTASTMAAEVGTMFVSSCVEFTPSSFCFVPT